MLPGLLALATAAFATPLVLPTTEDPRDWAAPAALAGLELGAEADGETAWVLDGASGWEVRVRGPAGTVTSAGIPRPHTAAAREDAAWLAASLLHEFRIQPGVVSSSPREPAVVPSAPASAPVAAATTPATPIAATVAAPLFPALEVVPPPQVPPNPPAAVDGPPSEPAEPPTLVDEPPVGASIDHPPAERDRAQPWVRAAVATSRRDGLSWGWGGSLGAGLAVPGDLWFGAELHASTDRDLHAVEAATLSNVDARLGGWWSPAAPVAPVLGATVDLSARSWRQGTAEVAAFVTPGATVDAGFAWRLTPVLSLVPLAHVHTDLATTLLLRPGEPSNTLAAVELGVSVGIRARAP